MVRGRRSRRGLGALAIFLTAIALQQATTRPWGVAAGPDGSRYELSIVGLSRIAAGSTASRTDCRWWPAYGDASLCGARAGGEDAYRRLRLAYPLLQVAMWVAVAGLLLQTLRVPRQRVLQAAVPATASALSAAGILVTMRGAREGLGALAGVAMRFDAPGFAMAVAAVALSALSAVLAMAAGPRSDASP